MSLPAVVSGAPSLALADQWESDALAAIDGVESPDEAEDLLRRIKLADQAIRLARLGADREQRWGRVRLLGERRYGELLGPAQHGGARDSTSTLEVARDHKVEHRAREVASVPEETFNEYVTEAEQPSRAGLLRTAKEKLAVHFSSATDEWSTPADLYALIAEEFNPKLDVCALESSAKCDRYFTPEDDGLAQDWQGVCWMNPPYGDVIGQWVAKAHEAADSGATVVCLVPARVDTGWWWDHCRHAEIRFLKGRLKFGAATTGAPFPSAVVVFGRPAKVVWWER